MKKVISLSALFLATTLTAANVMAESIVFHAPGRAEIQLDQTATLRGAVQVPAGFTGDIAMSTDSSKLPQGANEVSLITTPATIHVATANAAMTEIPVQITIRSQPGSHSFKALSFNVSAKSKTATSTQAIALTVDAIYEIDFTGGTAPEGWTSPMSVSMPKHDGGVTIRFVNMDTTNTHTVHGEDAIPHQETDPLAAATASAPGGVYEITVPSGDPVSGEYRCHDHEDETMLRTISFNN